MIKKEDGFKHNFSNATGRWAGVGPYYAMFPLTFAFDVVDHYTREGESVLDPFAGRGSSVYAAAVRERSGVAIEINPVGWIYGRAKLDTSSKQWVKRRLNKLKQYAPDYEDKADELPEFFDYCYTPQVQRFLLAARSKLNWRQNKSDATLMAIILVYLHGKRDRALSNQMRQAKAMSPDYSVRWWKEREMDPPQKDPYDFMEKRIEWRYKNGRPPSQDSKMLLGNSENVMKEIQEEVENDERDNFSLFLPPHPTMELQTIIMTNG